jgi:hypothetical protein
MNATAGQAETTSTETRGERFEREDLVLFISSCFACTGQREFYSTANQQQVSISFLHAYTLGNYRQIYARCLALQINDFNKVAIIRNLLTAGSPDDTEQRAEENALITAAIEQLPPQRVYRLFDALADDRVNNRRTRAIMKHYTQVHRDPVFDAVKYRRRFRTATRHSHIPLDGEIAKFLEWDTSDHQAEDFTNPLFRTYHEARYSKAALFDLPFTIAEGMAAKRGIDPKELLNRSQSRMTAGERLRVQRRAGLAGVDVDADLARMPLTRLAVYILSLALEEREARRDELDGALVAAARRKVRPAPLQLGRVAVIADRSFSTTGSAERRRRPLAVALGTVYLLRELAEHCDVIWVPSLSAPHLDVTPFGQTDLASPLVRALRDGPDLVVIVSDGFENAPTGLVAQVAQAAKQRTSEGEKASFVHLNPVFDVDNLQPRQLGGPIATVGVRDAEDLLVMLSFARFADGSATKAELDQHLAARTAAYIKAGSQ